jgi:hypothetical protein
MNINLIPLEGTEKQIIWAESIRANFFDQMSNAPEKNKQITADIFNRKPEAKWWIEEIRNKAEIDIRHVMRKCMDFATLDELQAYLISKM